MGGSPGVDTGAGRAVHITTVHPALDTRVFHREAMTLADEGYEVILVAPHEGDAAVQGVRIKGLRQPRNRLERMLGLTWRAYRLAQREQADVCHFHDPELLPVGLLLKLTTCARVIYDVHEDVPEQILTKHWIPRVLRRPVAAAVGLGEKLLARGVDAVVVATEGIAKRFVGFHPVVLRNFPSLSMFAWPDARERSGPLGRLIYVGGISRVRGAFEMVQALEHVARSSKVELTLVGRFEPAGLKEELSTLAGWQHVQTTGWLPPEVAYELLKKADIGLVCLHPLPRHVVALPVKLFEYMGAGLPVIASDFPLWKEIVEGNNCGLCADPLDPQAIAAAIEYLIAHPDEARQMGENGRRAVEEKYNWERESEKLRALYGRLLSR